MDTYTYKCPGCGAALTFDTKMNMLVCGQCMSFYAPESLPPPPEPENEFESAFHFSTAPGKQAANGQTETVQYNQSCSELSYEADSPLNNQTEFAAYNQAEPAANNQAGYAAYTQSDSASEHQFLQNVDMNSTQNAAPYKLQTSGSILGVSLEELTTEAKSESAFHFTSTPGAAEAQSMEIVAESNEDILKQKQYEYMDINVYHCSSCGAEIMTNDVEISKFCSFCGQSTIIFERVSKEKKPNKILPFGITKEDAIRRAQDKFKDVVLMPTKLENISVESVYGIYMPYFNYQCTMIYKTYNGRELANFDRDVLLDGSERLNDDVSRNLNPFSMDDAENFNAAYLSGSYADCCDVNPKARLQDAEEYMKTYSDIEFTARGITRNMPEEDVENIRTDFKIHNCEYVFCPVYFITFQVGNGLAIILVNGRNGKVVGSVPIDPKKFAVRQRMNILVNVPIWTIACAAVFGFLPIWYALMFFAILSFFLISSGRRAKKQYEEYLLKTNSASMFELSMNRDDGNY